MKLFIVTGIVDRPDPDNAGLTYRTHTAPCFMWGLDANDAIDRAETLIMDTWQEAQDIEAEIHCKVCPVTREELQRHLEVYIGLERDSAIFDEVTVFE